MEFAKVCRIGYGAMNLTWKPTQTPDEQAFEAIKQAVASVPEGSLCMVNSGFYGQPEPTLNLQLMSRFFAKYPEYCDKIYLSVKGGLARGELRPDASPENLLASVTTINETLAKFGGKKKMDLFEPARIDKAVPVEDMMKTLVKLKEEGHFSDIGLSEVNAQTIRRAVKIHPVAAVEVEVSLWSTDIFKNNVLATCKELNIPIVAYSPLGRGFLTGAIKKPEDVPAGDMRAHLDRFKPENWDTNFKLVEKVQALATKKNVSPAQLALAWLLYQDPLIYPIPGSTRPAGVKEAYSALDVKLSEQDLEEIAAIINSTAISGGRYNAHAAPTLEG